MNLFRQTKFIWLVCWLIFSFYNAWLNPFMTGADIIWKPMRSKSMDWFLYDIGLRHERVNSWAKYFALIWLGSVERATTRLVPVSSARWQKINKFFTFERSFSTSSLAYSKVIWNTSRSQRNFHFWEKQSLDLSTAWMCVFLQFWTVIMQVKV